MRAAAGSAGGGARAGEAVSKRHLRIVVVCFWEEGEAVPKTCLAGSVTSAQASMRVRVTRLEPRVRVLEARLGDDGVVVDARVCSPSRGRSSACG